MTKEPPFRSIFHFPDEFTRGRGKNGIPVGGVPIVFDAVADNGEYGWFLGKLDIVHGKYIRKNPRIFFPGDGGKERALHYLTKDIGPVGVLE